MKTKPQKDTVDVLKNFDSLPNSANVRESVVIALFACSRATLWRHVKKGTMPAPRKLADTLTVWRVGDLREFLEAAA